MIRFLFINKVWRVVNVVTLLVITLVMPLSGLTRPASATGITPLGWVGPLSVSASPPARNGAAMAYDAATGTVVLFGGSNGTNLSDTWLWNGTTWTSVTPTSTWPAARSYASMAYDAATGTVVLFGGAESGGLQNDTWSWNGTTWSQLAPSTSPPARDESSMAYDAATGTVVLFGGNIGGTSGGYGSDTWSWNGTTWSQLAPSTSPVGRYGAAMSEDSATSTVVLFGGIGSSGPMSDTWTWNGTNWTPQLAPTYPSTSTVFAIPPARAYASMAFDSTSSDVIMFGGYGDSGTIGASYPYLNDTWSWNGTNWLPSYSTTNPTVRAGATMAFDTASNDVVLFSGASSSSALLDDSWILATVPGAPSSVSSTSSASNVARVSWTAPLSNGGSAITSYTASATDLTNAARGGQSCGTSTSTSCVVAGLTNGDSYTFSVVAANGVGLSPVSSPSAPAVPATTPVPTTLVPTTLVPSVIVALGPPRGVTAASNLNDKSVVHWAPPLSNGGSAITGYTATAWPEGKSCSTKPPQTACDIVGLSNGHTYVITVTAQTAGGVSAPSGPPRFVTPRTTPNSVRRLASTVKNGVVTLRWLPPSSNGGAPLGRYQVFIGTTSRFTSMKLISVDMVARNSAVWRAARRATYFVIVRAVNLVGPGTLSQALKVEVR